MGLWILKRRETPAAPPQRTLTRITFDEGLQAEATWSPDGRYIAYSSDRSGKFDIWVQQVSGGDPIQITKGPGHHWQPDWSPDGKYIAYRSEEGEGGLYMIPALGGAQRKIAEFGYYPQWSPDSSRLLFQTHLSILDLTDRFYVVGLDAAPPQKVEADFVSDTRSDWEHHVFSAAWHPDGRRISLWAGAGIVPSFWTVPASGGRAIKTEISDDIAKQLEGTSAGGFEFYLDHRFSWGPAGTAIYFERTYRGAKNIWRLTVDPQTLRALSVQRMTTGMGPDTDISVSPDGKRIAFTSETRHVRAWMFPFDPARAQVTGPGQGVTSLGIEAQLLGLSRDGTRLVFGGRRGGRFNLWEKNLPGGLESAVVADDSHGRYFGQWSPDGKHIAYWRRALPGNDGQIVVWSSDNHAEEPLATPVPSETWIINDWSPDGRYLLANLMRNDQDRTETWLIPASSSSQARSPARRLIRDASGFIFQSHFSPDGRWIIFEDVKDKPMGPESALFVMRAEGGPWIPVTDGRHWDDKPRFGPDGRTVYFVSDRSGFFNVWAIHFDLTKGVPVGQPFKVTSFDRPSLMVPSNIQDVELSMAKDRFVITVEQVTGGIWLLDNVDR
jgi:Tol biopolymer transport system component